MNSCLQIATLYFGHTKYYTITNGCKLLKIFDLVLMFNSNEPAKDVHLQK